MSRGAELRRSSRGASRRRGRAPELNRYVQALVDGDEAAAKDVLARRVRNGVPLRQIHLEMLAPAMHRVGELWSGGDINVAEEHLATQMILGHMDKLRSSIATPPRSAPRAVIACPEGEHHLVGARMAADFFMMDGWRVDFLGGDVPTANLVEFLQKRRPEIVGLSVTIKANLKLAWSAIERVAGLSSAPRIVVGGQAVLTGLLKESAKRYCAIAKDAGEGVRLARALLNTETSPADLYEYLGQLGRRIRELRNHRGWTQQRLAAVTGVTRAYLVAVEGGKQNVTLDVVIRVANALAVAPEQLLASEYAAI